ncbi:MAG: hypothetical protein IKN24_02855, partial [Lachnospiraceae bacterium]|nr:hypothetical protein [Lachnospiraceae bacterium]
VVPDGAEAADVVVSGTSPVTSASYTGLSAGTYSVVSSADFEDRGVRIIDIVVNETPIVTKEYVLNPSVSIKDLAKKATIAAGVYGKDDYFTFSGSAVRGNSDTFSFELSKQEGGKLSFTVTGTADVVVSATSTGKSNESHMMLKSGEDGVVPDGAEAADVVVSGTSPVTSASYTGLSAGTYSVVSSADFADRGVRIIDIVVSQTASGERPPRKAWDQVAAPVISVIGVLSSGKVEVSYDMVTGYDGADSVKVKLVSVADESLVYEQSGSDGKASFTLPASGMYTATVIASRADEEDKVSSPANYDYVLPLATATISSVYNKGDGTVNAEWSAVAEAEKYVVNFTSDDATPKAGTSDDIDAALTSTDITGLTVGCTYSFTVTAFRGEESTTSEPFELKITGESQTKWAYIVYGEGANANNAGYTGGVNTDGQVTLRSGKVNEAGDLTGSGNNGKWIPDSKDGLNFYYTAVPSDVNFTLRALVHVDQWYMSNGQEAFGLMANDRLGGNGWNNSVAAVATKVEYSVMDVTDEDGKVVSQKFIPKTSGQTSYSQKLGIHAQAKTGLTADMFGSNGEPSSDTAKLLASDYAQNRYVLEQRFSESKNIIGGSVNNVDTAEGSGITDMYLTIQKNNTGYFVTYETSDGSYSVTKKYYEPDALSVLDPDNVYVGFVTSRYAIVTFSDITFTTIAAAQDAPAEERPVEEVPVTAAFVSPVATGIQDYTVRFTANCDGRLVFSSESGLMLKQIDVSAGVTTDVIEVTLSEGTNNYRYAFTPDADYVPGEYQKMKSYETVEGIFTVTYETFGDVESSLYVAPGANGSGSREDPMNIYDAVRFVRPGQYIIIMEGTYDLDRTVRVERGIDGTKEKVIYMIADPEATSRPVFDFGGKCAGMVFGGNYWYVRGFDVTHSADGQKGIQVSGNNNFFDDIRTYHNGNTGFQLSRLRGTDEFDMWPSNNIIANCTSFGNADSGYEDADGFAAKLTVGDSNAFIGCIAYNNADDGWDLYAKVQTGSIGSVLIMNCVAYGNGYLEDGTDAGNGNGFKLGGESMPAEHILIDCVAVTTTAKGIDSNSCPDIIVVNCTSYNNGSYNVALYTKTAENTAFAADGVISYRNDRLASALATGEYIAGVGTQAAEDIYSDTNYYWNGTASTNTEQATVSEDWFVTTDTTFDPVTHTFAKDIITRKEDKSIDMNGILVLTDAAPEDVGAVIHSIPSPAIDDVPDFVYSYKVLEGADQVIDEKQEVVIRIDAPLTGYAGSKFNDVAVPADAVKATQGSTILTFSADFIDSLEKGEYIVRMEFEDGHYAETKLTKNYKTDTTGGDDIPTGGGDDVPSGEGDDIPATNTGDALKVLLLMMCMAVSAGVISRRRRA